MHTQMPTWLGSIALGAFVAGCHVSHTKVVGPPPATFFVIPEVEVNDFAWAPQSIGLVHAGETIVLEGAITDQGWDPRDGYRFVAQQSLVVDVALDAHVPGVDLDWCVWDPYIGDYTVCAETGIDPEIGSFLVPQAPSFTWSFRRTPARRPTRWTCTFRPTLVRWRAGLQQSKARWPDSTKRRSCRSNNRPRLRSVTT